MELKLFFRLCTPFFSSPPLIFIVKTNDLCIFTHAPDQAAKESRRRKKMRIEELGRSVVFLTKENQELREQNELLRQMVVGLLVLL